MNTLIGYDIILIDYRGGIMEDTNLKMDIIKDYLNSTNSNTIDLKILLRLYSNYSKIAKIDHNKLKRYEDDVYTIKNEKMSDSERIIKEIDTIKIALKKCNDEKIIKYVNDKLVEMEEILKYDDYIFDGYIMYLKRTITELQALLNININFYNASCDAFIDMYKEIESAYNKKRIL